MKYKDIKNFYERCKSHPDHEGIITEDMLKERLHEEVKELRAYIVKKKGETWKRQ